MLTLRLEVGTLRLVLLKDGKAAPMLHIGSRSPAGPRET
jgi:hypothetical protein